MRDAKGINAASVSIAQVMHPLAIYQLTSWVRPESQYHPVHLAQLELASTVGTVTTGRARALCLAPGRWWAIESPYGGLDLAGLRAGCESRGVALVDISQGLGVIRVEGVAARALLEKGCGLDLHETRFPPQRAGGTRFASIAVVLDCVSAEPRFELYFAQSYSEYLLGWLEDAAIELETETKF